MAKPLCRVGLVAFVRFTRRLLVRSHLKDPSDKSRSHTCPRLPASKERRREGGTTPKIAVLNGRRWLGFEINADYVVMPTTGS